MINLSPAYLEWREKTLSEGEEHGIQIGEERGIQIGKQEGIQIGEERGRKSAVPILAELGLSSTEIAQRLDLSLDDVQRILDS